MTVKTEKAKPTVNTTNARNVKESVGITIGVCGKCGQGVYFNKGETSTKCGNCKAVVKK